MHGDTATTTTGPRGDTCVRRGTDRGSPPRQKRRRFPSSDYPPLVPIPRRWRCTLAPNHRAQFFIMTWGGSHSGGTDEGRLGTTHKATLAQVTVGQGYTSRSVWRHYTLNPNYTLNVHLSPLGWRASHSVTETFWLLIFFLFKVCCF